MSKLEVTELTKKISDEYPKVWEKLKEYKIKDSMLYLSLYQNKIWINSQGFYEASHFIVPFPMLYGLLDNYFKENGIIINIIHRNIPNQRNPYQYEIHKDNKEVANELAIIDDQTCREQAILKACEIFEESL